jgi:hypothetical protein
VEKARNPVVVDLLYFVKHSVSVAVVGAGSSQEVRYEKYSFMNFYNVKISPFRKERSFPEKDSR